MTITKQVETTYQFSKTFTHLEKEETVKVFLVLDFQKKTFSIQDYKKRQAFIFHNGNYAYRWKVIAELIAEASEFGINELTQFDVNPTYGN